jgi:hypothetical protein
MAAPTNNGAVPFAGKDLLKSQANEPVKQFLVYDGSGRMITHYVAYNTAADGDPCLRTDYVYSGGTTNITNMKESIDTWDSAWDF